MLEIVVKTNLNFFSFRWIENSHRSKSGNFKRRAVERVVVRGKLT